MAPEICETVTRSEVACKRYSLCWCETTLTGRGLILQPLTCSQLGILRNTVSNAVLGSVNNSSTSTSCDMAEANENTPNRGHR